MVIPDPEGFELPHIIYTPCDEPGYRPMHAGHTASDLNLVVEGGALRGIFAAGAMDFFMDMGLWAKDLIGVSAGALSGFNYVSGQKGRTCYINTRFCNEWRYLSIQSFLATGNAYGVEFAFHEVPDKYSPQDNVGFRTSPCRLHTVATSLETGQATYMLMEDPETQMDFIRASSAMPFVSQNVYIDGKPYLDGGIADSIPIDYSMNELGAKKHIVLLTQMRDYSKDPSPFWKLGHVVYRNYPEFCEAMLKRHDVYNATRAKIEQLHDEGKIFAIWPQRHPDVKHMETNRLKVFSLWLEGYVEAQRQWPALKAYLES